MENAKTIIFLSEMPVTNGVIQAQLLPVVFAAVQEGYNTYLIETSGRFDSQEKFREKTEKELQEKDVNLLKISVPRHTILPSILYFTLKTCPRIRKIWKKHGKSNVIIYARNYKFCPVLIINKLFRQIPFIYSPRGAYVAERMHYKKIKDILYGGLIGFFEKKAIENSAATVAETEDFRKHLEEIYKLNEDKITVIHNYYDEILFPPSDWDREKMREKLGYQDKKVIVYAGTLEIWYDFSKMFDLVSRLKKIDSQIFFQLFAKIDYARDESKGMAEKITEIAGKYNFEEGKDYAISSYPPRERYRYLSACDAGICLTTPEKFKTMMLYLKIVDYIGAGLPIIVNSDIGAAAEIIKNSGIGAMVDYENWEKSANEINMDKLLDKSNFNPDEYEKYSSQNVLPEYIKLFDNITKKSAS